MLLKEIIQTQTSLINAKNKTFQQMQNGVGDKKTRDPNAGAQGHFSKVRQDPNDPFMVQKSQKYHFNTQNDAYPDFIYELSLSDQKDNIFFPKIYNIKAYKDSTGMVLHKYQMEKLVNWTSVDDEYIQQILESIFTKKVLKTISNYEEGIAALANCIYDDKYSDIINGELVKALKFIRTIFNSREYFLDLRVENTMLRQTQYGYQLVITDPFGLKR